MLHIAAHVCVLASRTSNGKRQPIPLAAAVVVVVALFLFFFFFFGLWQYVCVCPGLGARLHSLSARCEGHRLVLGFLLASALPRQCSPTAQQL